MNSDPRRQPSIWHEGEIEVQRRAGVRDQAEELTGMYRREVQPAMVGFLAQQRLAVITTVDEQGRTWSSLVAGEPGMLQVPDLRVIRLFAPAIETTLPIEHIKANPLLGMLVMDFTRRIRVRINGVSDVEPDGSVLIGIRQTYGNCSQYIQRRTVIAEASPARSASPASSNVLSQSQQEMIRRADTFFLGSVHPESGADSSHRGGLPGFVEIATDRRITFPDYAGNNMFNTLGNIAVNPSVGLMFFDFTSGRELQLTGRASVDWDPERAKAYKGAKRVIDIDIVEVRETPKATSLRYQFESYSPFLTQE
ncbi:MAG TPA: pyridoxamine 5'-phosphate oxidase family protein [Terriglobales bacterium]|nr:pyridoxamine 5'-phosphate oxidase family protein [Terriglobales bacterium]